MSTIATITASNSRRWRDENELSSLGELVGIGLLVGVGVGLLVGEVVGFTTSTSASTFPYGVAPAADKNTKIEGGLEEEREEETADKMFSVKRVALEV